MDSLRRRYGGDALVAPSVGKPHKPALGSAIPACARRDSFKYVYHGLTSFAATKQFDEADKGLDQPENGAYELRVTVSLYVGVSNILPIASKTSGLALFCEEVVEFLTSRSFSAYRTECMSVSRSIGAGRCSFP